MDDSKMVRLTEDLLQTKKTSQTVTELVNRQIDQLIQDRLDQELETVLQEEDQEKLAEFFGMYLENALTFGDYIYLYIYRNTPLCTQYENYKKVPPEVYYKEYIAKSFENRLGKRSGSLNPQVSVSLSTVKPLLAGQKAPTRDKVFLFAFGLGMDVETVSMILKKCLMEADFNMKDPKEVIYYWCLKQNIPYSGMLRWMEYYESMNVESDHARRKLTDVDRTGTYLLSSRVRQNFRDDEDIKAYLFSLKKADSSSRLRKSAKEVYRRLFHAFPHTEVSQAQTVFDEKEISQSYREYIASREQNEEYRIQQKAQKKAQKEDEKYTAFLQVETGVRILAGIRKRCYEENKEQLLEPKVLAYLFQDLSFTKKTVMDRIYGDTPVSRKELLTAEFIVYMVELPEDEREEKQYAEGTDVLTYRDRQDSIMDFEEDVSATLAKLEMERFYVRNPFELFLVFCLLHRDPFAYFMASWEGSNGNER